MARTLEEHRERNRSVATSIVSIAIMLIGGAFVALAVILPIRGGAGFLLLSVLLGGIGIAALVGGFFFHLVPSRLEELADEKRAFDAREREAARVKDKRLGRG